MSMFDPNSFLDAQTTEVNEKRPLLPTENPTTSDGLYVATIGEIPAPKSGTISKGDNAGKPWVMMMAPLKIEVPAELQALGIPKTVTINYTAFLDLTAEGNLDNSKGKNNAQRVLREAAGMNVPGQPFSWRMLTGRPVKVKVKHKSLNDTFVEDVGGILPA